MKKITALLTTSILQITTPMAMENTEITPKSMFKKDSFPWEIMHLLPEVIGEIKTTVHELIQADIAGGNEWIIWEYAKGIDIPLDNYVTHENPILLSLLYKKSIQKNYVIDVFSKYKIEQCYGHKFTPEQCSEFIGKKVNLLNKIFTQWHSQPQITLKFDLSEIQDKFDLCRNIFDSITPFDSFKNPQLHMVFFAMYEISPEGEKQIRMLLDFVKTDPFRHLPLTLTLAAGLDNAIMPELQSLPNLTSLDFDLNGTKFCWEGLPAGIDDAGLRLMTNIRALNINYNINITDRGLEPLTQLRSLDLGIINRKFTYEGLRKLTNLTSLNIKSIISSEVVGRQLSEEELEQLKLDIPGLKVL